VRERSAKLIFIDGLRSVRDLWRNEAILREFLYEIGVGLAAADCVGLLTTEYATSDLMALPEATTVDGIVSLAMNHQGVRRLRRAEVIKLRGRAHLSGEHFLSISSALRFARGCHRRHGATSRGAAVFFAPCRVLHALRVAPEDVERFVDAHAGQRDR
jgi:KaiC/GvpD/RAD55 family RecA-like ATPase